MTVTPWWKQNGIYEQAYYRNFRKLQEEDFLFLFCGRRCDRIKALLWEGVFELTMSAYIILRIIVQESLKKQDDSGRKKIRRCRIRTAIKNNISSVLHVLIMVLMLYNDRNM